MKHSVFALALFLAPSLAFAQQPAPADTQTPPQSGQNVQAGPSETNPPQTRQSQQRRRRTIVNREFSDHDKIILLLNAHCDFPSKEDLLATSPDAETILRDILMDESVLFSVRLRAVEALAYFNTPQNLQTIEWILSNPDKVKHQLMLIQAIRAYPKVAPQQAPAALAPYLESSNDMVRFVTINSLQNCPGDAAVQVLSQRYEVEKNRFFQMRIHEAIENHCKQNTYCDTPRK